jgi:hypothetical protein
VKNKLKLASSQSFSAFVVGELARALKNNGKRQEEKRG